MTKTVYIYQHIIILRLVFIFLKPREIGDFLKGKRMVSRLYRKFPVRFPRGHVIIRAVLTPPPKFHVHTHTHTHCRYRSRSRCSHRRCRTATLSDSRTLHVIPFSLPLPRNPSLPPLALRGLGVFLPYRTSSALSNARNSPAAWTSGFVLHRQPFRSTTGENARAHTQRTLRRVHKTLGQYWTKKNNSNNKKKKKKNGNEYCHRCKFTKSRAGLFPRRKHAPAGTVV